MFFEELSKTRKSPVRIVRVPRVDSKRKSSKYKSEVLLRDPISSAKGFDNVLRDQGYSRGGGIFWLDI
jgi:hypothetical protein